MRRGSHRAGYESRLRGRLSYHVPCPGPARRFDCTSLRRKPTPSQDPRWWLPPSAGPTARRSFSGYTPTPRGSPPGHLGFTGSWVGEACPILPKSISATSPRAIQVADRFHLSVNASAAPDEVLRNRRRRTEYVVVASDPELEMGVASALPPPPISRTHQREDPRGAEHDGCDASIGPPWSTL
jgi:hypothetical protein